MSSVPGLWGRCIGDGRWALWAPDSLFLRPLCRFHAAALGSVGGVCGSGNPFGLAIHFCLFIFGTHQRELKTSSEFLMRLRLVSPLPRLRHLPQARICANHPGNPVSGSEGSVNISESAPAVPFNVRITSRIDVVTSAPQTPRRAGLWLILKLSIPV